MNTRTITIEPITRIEGHAKVSIRLNEAGQVENTFLHVDEFRGLEKFSEGRPCFEMPMITQRICGICPVSHHLASVKACDAIMGADPPRPAKLLRELLHMAQYVQSHGMHFFHLAGPDLVFGFDAPVETRNVFGIIEADPQLALKAVALRKYGQRIIERLSGKRVHPNFAIPGGINAGLKTEDRDAMAGERETMLAHAQDALAIMKNWMAGNRDVLETFATFPSCYMGMTDEHGSLRLYDGEIRIIDESGDLMVRFFPEDYLEWLAEHVEPWTFLKFPYYRPLGWPDGSYRVGPLARLNVAKSIPTPIAQKEFALFRKLNGGKPVEGSLFYHTARLIELIHALERIGELLDDPDLVSSDVRAFGASPSLRGIGAIEAPRGTLFHDYTTDENGLLTKVNLIVATGHNNWAMNRASGETAKQFVNGNTLTEGVLNRVEAAIRCYDPCLSCATHALGRMPLVITLEASDGTVLDRRTRQG